MGGSLSFVGVRNGLSPLYAPALEDSRLRHNSPSSIRYDGMGTRQKCRYCHELAVAYRLETDGTKTPLCAYHIPVEEKAEPPKLGSNDQARGGTEPDS
jgi:hypothetical protein